LPRLFISHSSRDNVYALTVQGWLVANGWDPGDIFIDLHDIGAGERWRDTLRKANAACEAVILLASPHSMGSIECQKEIELAEALGKEIITAIIRDLAIDDPRLARFAERQVVDLSEFPRDHVEALTWQGQDHRIGFNPLALAKIKARLSVLGISPGSFPWPPRDRPNAEPYPGLNAFDEDDAGIFFGRDADIMAALTEIRLVRRRRSPRLIVIDAASGAGKSSFLRAGLWPRLKRDPDFAPLAILRPSQGLITGPDGIGRRIAPFFERHQEPRAAGSIYAPLMAENGRAAQAFAALMADAVALATQVRRVGNPEAPPPAPLIAIDQAEELLAAEHSAESDRLLALLAAFLRAPPEGIDLYVLLTIRADSVQKLLDRVAALGLETPKALYLPPMSPAAYREVIIKPAEVYSARVKRLQIEPMLADALVRDATGADALPLLAFTLARLFGDFAADGRLTHEGYVAMGGIAGSIRRALGEARAAAGVVGSMVHLRRLLVPALVTWDPEAADGKGAARRLPAPEAPLLAGPRAELAPLAQALVHVRLLRRDRETLEVAHEALLRVPPISDWLEEDRDFLIWRDRAAKARAAYAANARGLLVGRELDIARGWLEARGDLAEIAESERVFIAASATADEKRRRDDAQREHAFQAAQLEAARAREAAAELELLRAKEREAEAKAREEAAQERAVAARRAARRTLAGLVAACMLALVASGAGWWGSVKQGEAQQHAAMAEQNAAKAEERRQEAVEHQKKAEAESKKARGAEKVVSILSSQTKSALERVRTREERDKEIYARLQREASSGNVTAMRYVGLLTFYGQGVAKDDIQANDWWEKAAAAGDSGAMANIGWLYANGRGVPQDYAKAWEWYEKAAAAGNAFAMVEIGLLYHHGRGVPQDYAKVHEWFEKAVAAGDSFAMADIGVLYRYGRGVPQDYAKAREWFEKAVAAGDTVAMSELGVLHRDGLGVPRDYAKAREWYEKAAAKGNTFAMAEIGVLYANARGVPQDYAKAREWYEKAAAAGDAFAMVGIGLLVANGQGVPQDYVKAREWFENAAAAGDKGALGSLSWHALFAREYAHALDAAERALKTDPSLLWIETNRAHALMLLGRAAEAREVYLAHRDKRIPNNANKLWQEGIAEDFAELRKAGIEHPQMAEIETALGIARP
jgi:TPR repeat protein